MSSEFADALTSTEDLPVYAVTTGVAQQDYKSQTTRPWLQQLSMPAASYALAALILFAISHGRRQPYLRTVFSRPSLLEVPVALGALIVYLAPMLFAFGSMQGMWRLHRSLQAQAQVVGKERFALPKSPLKPNRQLAIRSVSFAIVVAFFGLVRAPAAAIRACVALCVAQAVLIVMVLALEHRRGVQVFVVRKELRWRFYAFHVRTDAVPMEEALRLANTKLIVVFAARLFYDGRYEDSMALVKARFAYVPEATVALNIACCLTRLKRYDEAVRWLRKADALLPLTRWALRDSDLTPLRRAGLLDEFEVR
jgi:tetratricopeptide (TPR) repeat protein